jgi:hypothetical protein
MWSNSVPLRGVIMANVYSSPHAGSSHPLANPRTTVAPGEDDLRVFSGIMFAVGASILLWTGIAVLAYAAYRMF